MTTGRYFYYPLPARTALVIACLFALLQSLDVLTTALGLRNGAVEANPLAAGLLAGHGELALYGAKLLVAGLVLGAVCLLDGHLRRVWLAPRVANAVYVAVVAVNLTAVL